MFGSGFAGAADLSGIVVDGTTKKPIEAAFVTLGTTVARTDANGHYQISGTGEDIGIRAYGYLRRAVTTASLAHNEAISLTPFTPKALYLSFYGIGSQPLRESALELIRATELNALVIDVKGDRGRVAFRSSNALAAEVGAQKIITIKDAKALIGTLHQNNIYTIARIVVFKDDQLAMAKPALALKTVHGVVWKDKEGLAWTNPYDENVWKYNIDLAVEAAQAGFDEIQFDYVRFPDATGLAYSRPNTEENRVAAISGFLAEARQHLVPYNVFLAADIFGYVVWNSNDTSIGQKLGNLVSPLDYLSLMLYPSGFQFGIPGYENPVAHPGQIVHLSLEKARQRTGLPTVRFRPWLQAFRDYAFDRTPFESAQIRAQIEAAEKFGSDGWMLWNPRNSYSSEGLKLEH